MGIKASIYKYLINFPLSRNIMYGVKLYSAFSREYKLRRSKFIKDNFFNFYIQPYKKNKSKQIYKLLKKVDISPVNNKTFFYSIDCFKTVEHVNKLLENFTVDYQRVVSSSFYELKEQFNQHNVIFRDESILLDGIEAYIEKCKKYSLKNNRFLEQISAIECALVRPAQTLFEALQRILFYNQLLWQTGHRHNGLGRLDLILIDYYRTDVGNGIISREQAIEYFKDFFRVLHSFYWFKSGMMLGDTGQIIVLGGKDERGTYEYNELTKIFIEISKELMLPDPKIFLRCSSNMPDELLSLALECISTGLGAPLLSNDDAVIPALLSCGYDSDSAYNYVASACWEPLTVRDSCDLNNIKSINFAVPLINMFENSIVSEMDTMDTLFDVYCKYLAKYINEQLEELITLKFEVDPIISLLSHNAAFTGKDITRGGAIYNNLGLTSVGLASVVDSFLNIEKFVFVEKELSLEEFNIIRKSNYLGDNNESFRKKVRSSTLCYGYDDAKVISYTRRIMSITNETMKRHQTRYNGMFKIGLSSPFYIEDAIKTGATFDGRKAGEPFNVHISSRNAVPNTALILFASQLDYSECLVNGNVVDFFETSRMLNENMEQYKTLLRVAFEKGLFQLQMNVIDSQTLIKAKNNPDLFSNLVVRVWGFSAYFNDLPEEYKDLLIMRALESEKNS